MQSISRPDKVESHIGTLKFKDGRYKQTVQAGVDWLVSNIDMTQGNNYGGFKSVTNMYSQGIATLALVEAYGMTRDPALKPAAQAAIDYIQKAQGRNGSWGCCKRPLSRRYAMPSIGSSAMATRHRRQRRKLNEAGARFLESPGTDRTTGRRARASGREAPAPTSSSDRVTASWPAPGACARWWRPPQRRSPCRCQWP